MLTSRSAVALLVLGLVLAAPGDAAAKRRGRTINLTIGPFPIQAHRDREVCRVVRVRGIGGMQIEQWEARSRTSRGGQVGTHHFVAYGYGGGDAAAFPAPDQLVDDPGCTGLGPRDFYRQRVFLAGSGGESQRGRWLVTSAQFPGGLTQAMPTLADQPDDGIVILNSHYFNGTDRTAKGFVKLKIRLAPLDPSKRVVRQMTDSTASHGIRVPPGEVGPPVTATWAADGARNYATEGGYNPADDVCILAITPHMHKRGTLFTIDYEEDGAAPSNLVTTTDYLHPPSALLPLMGTAIPGLLRAHTAENGHPRLRYSCLHANGAEGIEAKMGCEEVAGVAPGRSGAEAYPDDPQALGLADHARPCGLDAVNCRGFGTGNCVPANLVFGPLSDDEMCILVALVYEPRRDVAPELACHPNY